MKYFVLLFTAAFLFLASHASAAESHYEVYYFHASWRCTNCNNAEAWSKEAVDIIRQANPNAGIVFVPVQLETNQELVKLTKAKRVDLVVVEARDGKIARFLNIGNLLPLVGSKSTVIQTAIDGILAFDAQTPGGARLARPQMQAAK